MAIEPESDALSQLVSQSGLTPAQLIDAATKGAVWHKRSGAGRYRRVRNLDACNSGDLVSVNYNQQVLDEKPTSPQIVSDQNNYSVWIKPAGMLSQGSKWGDHCTITAAVHSICGKPAHLVHRLDKAASGLIVIAHTRNALTKLADLFARRQIEKTYHVQVIGEFSNALPLTINTDIDAKSAVTTILAVKGNSEPGYSKLVVSIESGRKHQIRRHLLELGFPVVGDRLYLPEQPHNVDLQLRAVSLSFVCPFSGERMCFEI